VTQTRRRRGQRGFTLIELIVVVTIIGILAGIAVVQVKYSQRKARESALKADLYEMRKAIDNYFADKQHYPSNLQELVPHYLRGIPKDPITQTQDWEEVMDNPEDPQAPADASGLDDGTGGMQQPGVIDVKSKAPGTTLDNVAYHDL
jgi:general secretion pathway protein G